MFYTLDPETGDIDKYSGIKGDIRTSVTYDNGRLYFCTKGGKVCRIDVDEDGYLSNYTELQLVDDKNGGKNGMNIPLRRWYMEERYISEPAEPADSLIRMAAMYSQS